MGGGVWVFVLKVVVTVVGILINLFEDLVISGLSADHCDDVLGLKGAVKLMFRAGFGSQVCHLELEADPSSL